MNDKHYHPAVAARLRVIMSDRDWNTLLSYLRGLSNAHFRTAGYMLGEQYMPELTDEDFWQLATVLVEAHPKAFLVTVLKSAVQHRLLVPAPPIEQFLSSLTGREEDVRKTLSNLLPSMKTPEDALWLLSTLDCYDPHQRINYFINYSTRVTGFLLLKVLHEVEDDHALLVRTASFLMKKGDGFSFNLASLICACFGLDEVKGTFSLRIRPYELSRLTTDFAAFSKALNA